MASGSGMPLGLCQLLHSAGERGDSPLEWEGMIRLLSEGAEAVTGSLLHTAVRKGRLLWTRKLLAVGANPMAEDGSHSTALRVATEMNEEHPNDEERSGILELIRVVTSRDEAKGQTPSYVTSGGVTNVRRTSERLSTDASLRPLYEAIDNVSREVSSMKVAMEEMNERMLTRFYVLSQEMSSTTKAVDELRESNRESIVSLNTKECFGNLKKEVMSTFSDVKMSIKRELACNRETLDRIKTEMISSKDYVDNINAEIVSALGDMNMKMSIERELASNRETLDSIKTEVISSKESVDNINAEIVSALGDMNTSTTRELASIRESLDLMKVEMISSKESLEAVKKEIYSASLSVWRREQMASHFRLHLRANPSCTDGVKQDSIEAMMKMTSYYEKDDAKVSQMRSIYEFLYSRSPLTAILIDFLRFYPSAKVRVDCDFDTIGRMKRTITDHDGEEWNGGTWTSFEVLEEETVYLGALVNGSNTKEWVAARLAKSLCVLSTYLLFKNKGLPYSEGDRVNEKRFMDILKAVEQKRKEGGVDLGWNFKWALDKKTILGKSLELISRVPLTIALHGSTDGTSIMREWKLDDLLAYYEDHVVASLARDWQSKMASLSY